MKNSAAESERPPKILVVEDDPDDFDLLRRAFAQIGCESLHRAKNGEDAVKYLRKPPGMPSLIVCDLKMSGMNGFELLKTVKSDPDLRKIPFIVFTASNDAKDRAQCRKDGADLYLVKPTRFTNLVEIATRLFDWAKKGVADKMSGTYMLRLGRLLTAFAFPYAARAGPR